MSDFRYHCDQAKQALSPRACQCAFCLPRGASYLSDPSARLEVQLEDRRLLYAHLFGTGTAEFMHCGRCNELVYVRCEIEGRDYGLVVAAALADPPAAATTQAAEYGAETLEERLARRAARWIPEVEIIEDA